MSLKEAAAEVLRVIEARHYTVGDRIVSFARYQDRALAGTRVYLPHESVSLPSISSTKPSIRIVDGTTQIAALQMVESNKDRIALLNFASARNPGGGFLNGAKAQEEDLCRCSGLYPCLLRCMEYYEANRKHSSLLYTDHAIFSPDVPFFKTRGTGEYLPQPFAASVITAPAPNSASYLRDHPAGFDELERTFERRWQIVLRIARLAGIDRLLLGAWGCGAFGGDPAMESRTAHAAIESDGSGLSEIVFAIPNAGRQSQANYEAFQRTFSR